jgi:hypothetical protein
MINGRRASALAQMNHQGQGAQQPAQLRLASAARRTVTARLAATMLRRTTNSSKKNILNAVNLLKY